MKRMQVPVIGLATILAWVNLSGTGVNRRHRW